MKRVLCGCLIAAVLFAGMPASFASNNDEILADGLVSYQEEGDLVSMIQIRLRDLGFFLFKPTGKFRSMTRNSVITFQTYQVDANGMPIIADGTVGEQSLALLFSNQAMRAPIGPDVHFPSLRKGDGQVLTGTRMVWDEVKTALREGNAYTLTDCQTGETFSVVYSGGEKHAEVECATPADTAAYKAIFGDSFNYYKRPMLLSLGSAMVACSLQGQPHGEDIVGRNEMDGHACLYFDGSRSHVGGIMDVEHAVNVHAASKR